MNASDQMTATAFVLCDDGLFYADPLILTTDWTLTLGREQALLIAVGESASPATARTAAELILATAGIDAEVGSGPEFHWGSPSGKARRWAAFTVSLLAPLPRRLLAESVRGFRQPHGDRLVLAFGRLWG